MPKLLFSCIVWLLGTYFILFAVCFYAHVNESNIIAKRAEALLPKLTRENKSGLPGVAAIQNMGRIAKPSLLEPHTLVDALFGKRQSYKEIKQLLGKAIEILKDDLSEITLGPVDLEEIDLSKTDLNGTDLGKANLLGADLSQTDLFEANLNKANLRGADLTRAFLINANLNSTDLSEANFDNTNFYRTDIGAAILKGSNLGTAINLTCGQIKSAVIDKDTRLPDYILLAESSGSDFNCKNRLEDKGVNFKGMNLAQAFLDGADLQNANLSKANLMGAKLDNADLRGANLRGSNLKGANFYVANLHKADLMDADLRGANLHRVYHLPDCSHPYPLDISNQVVPWSTTKILDFVRRPSSTI